MVDAETIFALNGGQLTTMRVTPYETEDVLQRALATHPEVVAGPTTVGDTAPGLLLVRREMGVPNREGGSRAFSLDHLFIDAEAVPVLVEVKRSTDTRIRREVVGQMLDYVANAVTYWPVASLREALDREARAGGTDTPTGDDLVAEHWPGGSVDEFWRTVEANLRAGRVRMLFVADRLPAELVRVIEFLNEQMSPAEVLGVELRQYTNTGADPGAANPLQVLVPRVVGRTSAAVSSKIRSSGGQSWTRESFLEQLRQTAPAPAVELATRLLDDVETHGQQINWGSGTSAGLSAYYLVAGTPTSVWMMYAGTSDGRSKPRLEPQFPRVSKRLVAADRDTTRLETSGALLATLGSAAHKVAEARATGWAKSPQLALADLCSEPSAAQTVLDAMRALADPPGAPVP